MRGFSGFLMMMGFGSAVLYFINVHFTLLAWADNWQPAFGLGMGALGLLVFVLLMAFERKQAAPPPYQGTQQPYPPQPYQQGRPQQANQQFGQPQPVQPPHYGQPQQAQPQYGQAPYGQPQHGQPNGQQFAPQFPPPQPQYPAQPQQQYPPQYPNQQQYPPARG